jgi:hypothetical protein
MLLQILTRISNVGIELEGKACATLFKIVHLSVQDRYLLFQPISWDSSLSCGYLKSFILELEENIGEPKYIASFLRDCI